MIGILLAVAAAIAVNPQAFVERFSATYMKQHRAYGLLEGKDRRVMAPFLTARLLRQLDDASACQRDWARQQPKGSTDKPPYVDCCLFFGIADGNPTSIKTGAVEAMPDGRTKVVVDCELKLGADDIRWRDAVIVTMENGRWAVDDFVYDLDRDAALLSKSFTECRGKRWIGQP
jgi:hypothetical protein